MSKPTDIRILSATCEFEHVPFRAPLKFGGRTVDSTFLMNVTTTVETRSGKQAAGTGSMPVGNVWAWPSAVVDAPLGETAMKAFAAAVTEEGAARQEFAHPLDHIHEISQRYDAISDETQRTLALAEPLPKLAQLVSASPFDAAVHDAFGRANGISSFNGLSKTFMKHDLAHYLDDNFRNEYLDRYTLRKPTPRLPLYHLIGALDPLTNADIAKRIEDGLPETLTEWIVADGLTHMKIKLNGDDIDWDVNRVLSIDRVAREAQRMRGCSTWYYSCDFNEKCANVEYVLSFLARVQQGNRVAFERIQYIEQPTSRDLKSSPDNRMHEAAKVKPVVIDESLVDYESLLLSREMGYTGVALKACKGQTDSLLLAAAAQKFGMFLCVQDLTCPGYSFLHSASLAAHIPGIAAIEGNGRQYCPAPNRPLVKKFPGMFDINDGTVRTSELGGIGLGF